MFGKTFNVFFVMGMMYIAAWAGVAWDSIGEVPSPPSEPYTFELVVAVVVVFLAPFVLGILSNLGGQEE